MPKGSKLLQPSKLAIVIGEPLQPPPPSENGRVSRKAVKQLTDELRADVQKLFDDARQRHASPASRLLEHLRVPEQLSHLRLEVLERQRVVVGVEGDLIPLVGELLGQRELLG